jgi:ubiquinone/menaquinone biosynthesis C-methylase UbiE
MFYPVDVFDSLVGRRKELVPPKGLIYTGRKEFEEIGDRMFQLFVKDYKLEPDYKILDVGCGIGRLARPFVKFLNSHGAYYGFDVVETGIKWCKKAYSEIPKFHFEYVSLHNDLYNVSTSERPSAYSFSYANDSFDFAMVISVFTHMQEEDVQSYLNEIRRVLKPDRYCFCTFFIITAEVEHLLSENVNVLFKYNHGNFFLHDENVRDANIAYRDSALQNMVKAAGLEIVHFFPGWWPGYKKSGHIDYQDVVVLKK